MKIITQEQIESLKSFINSHEQFLVTGHKDPDGDCISSCLGTSLILEALHKKYILVNAGPFKRTEIKKYHDKFVDTIPFMTQEERNQTGLILNDCSELLRIGEVGDLKGFDTFIIDHHKTSEPFVGAKSIIDPSSPAASCLVQMLYEGIVGPLTKEASDILFFGFCTDTGFFRFLRNDSCEVFDLVSRMIKAGSNPNNMYDIITGGKPYSTRKLLGIHLSHAERYCNGRVVLTYETLEDTRKYGTEGRDSDTLYQSFLSCDGVEAVVFVRQETEFSCTAGFRSKNDVDVSAIAAKFGGGGHKNAAGMSTEGKLDTLIPAICKEFARVLG